MAGLLDGIRVLDFGRFIAGPYCAGLLGDMGAEVIRVERIGGGEDRFIAPVAESGEGGTFLQLNRNKKSLALKLDTAEAKEIVQVLVKNADVVVANLPEITLRRLHLDYESLTRIRPGIVLASISAFGDIGPYKDRVGFDGVGQVMSGAAYMGGSPDRPATWSVPYVDFTTALSAAFGVMCALYHRRDTGQGQHVRASLLKSALTVANSMLIEQSIASPNRIPQGSRAYQIGPGDLFHTKDGKWLLVQVLGDALFRRWAKLMGSERRWVTDPRFVDDRARGANGEVLSARMQEWCETRTLVEAVEALSKARIPSAPVFSPQDALDDPHMAAGDFFTPMSFSGLKGKAPVVSPICELSRTPAEYRAEAPTVGRDTKDVLSMLGYSDGQIKSLSAAGIIQLGA